MAPPSPPLPASLFQAPIFLENSFVLPLPNNRVEINLWGEPLNKNDIVNNSGEVDKNSQNDDKNPFADV